MNNEIYQKVVEELAKYLPEGWEKVAMEAEVTETTSNVTFFVYVNNKYINVFDLPEKFGISEELTDLISENFHPILLPDQQEKKWFSMSFYLKNTGEFNVEYEYNEPDDIIQAHIKWQAKYKSQNMMS